MNPPSPLAITTSAISAVAARPAPPPPRAGRLPAAGCRSGRPDWGARTPPARSPRSPPHRGRVPANRSAGDDQVGSVPGGADPLRVPLVAAQRPVPGLLRRLAELGVPADQPVDPNVLGRLDEP